MGGPAAAAHTGQGEMTSSQYDFIVRQDTGTHQFLVTLVGRAATASQTSMKLGAHRVAQMECVCHLSLQSFTCNCHPHLLDPSRTLTRDSGNQPI